MLEAKHTFPLLSYFNITHSFFNVNITTLTGTWIALCLIVTSTIVLRFFLKKHSSVVRYATLEITRSFIDICTQSLGYFDYKHGSFLFTLFIFIFMCNIVGIIPHVEEPTIDINTTFALGIISFIYTNGYAIYTHGIKEYSKEFIQPFFVMLPLHIIGKISSILSISFRLFGNMMGGFVISNMYFGAVSSHWIGIILNYISGLNLLVTLFFGLFESLIQAFVFTLLSLTYLSLALQHDESEGDH